MYQSNKYNEHLNFTGAKIKEFRLRNNLSLGGLSIKLALLGIDIPRQSLYKLENGERVLKDFELFSLAYLLKIPLEDLLEDFVSELHKEEIV